MIDRIINRHLHDYLHTLPRWKRLKMWHWNRVAYNDTLVFWLLKHVWWIPGLKWLWRLRCRSVNWRMEHHNRHVVANAPVLYTWTRG